MKKILLLNPKLLVYKEHIDYPYFLNIHIFLLFSFFWKNFTQEEVNISFFDAFSSAFTWVKKRGDYFEFWGDFDREKYDTDFDYIFVNFSPFLVYHQQNIENLQAILSSFPQAKIVYVNMYSWGFCYIDYSPEFLRQKWLSFATLLNGRVEEQILSLFWKESSDNPPSFVDYKSLSHTIDFTSYFSFLLQVSQFWVLDFYTITEKSIPFYTSVGCIFSCNFCTSANPKIKWYSSFPLETIEEQIDFLVHKLWAKKLIILDALFNKDREFTLQLLDIFIKYNLKIEIPNGVRIDLLDESIIQKLSQVLTRLSVSIESWSQRVNSMVIWKWLQITQLPEKLSLLKKYGIEVLSHYIIWFPDETKEEINQTLEFAYKQYIDFWVIPLLQFATPLPWTRLWEQVQENLYEENIYEKFQTDSYISSPHFTQEELSLFKENFYKKIEVSKTKKIIINLTYACQNNCVFCATGDRFKLSQDFGYVVWQLINYYKKWVRLLDLDGGEPTLYKDLTRVVKVAKKIGYSFINLTSSWRRLKDTLLLESIIQSGIDSLLISLHWTKDSIHDAITQKQGSFQDTIAWIKNIVETRKKYPIHFGINITLCQQNQKNLEEYLHFIEQFYPDTVNVQFMTPFWNAQEMEALVQDTEKCCLTLKQILPQLSYKVHLINLPFCFMEGFESYVVWDIQKMERDMLFVWETPSNLYNYLAVKRVKKECCTSCTFSIVCDGFYSS